jgi:hypothetical protein
MKSKDAVRLPGTGLVGLFLVVTEVFLAVRFVLHFFAVNPDNGFARWIFNSTNGIVTPFRGVFTQTVVGHPHYVDLVTLFVMAAYVVVAVVLGALIGYFHEVAVTGVTTPRKR